MQRYCKSVIYFLYLCKLSNKSLSMKEPIKILFISQEIVPYLPASEIATMSREFPQFMQERGCEIRTFMPCYGHINERRNQLHEVQRLSGMNLIIDDCDHPLVIKVASIQSARMQVYFIDNEDYFRRKGTVSLDGGEEFEDNDERAIFYVRGVLETIKKLRWSPDIIHCHGWFTALAPLYIKKVYSQDPFFRDSKVVYTVYDNPFTKEFRNDFSKKLMFDGVEKSDVANIEGRAVDYVNLNKLAVDFSDGVIQGSPTIDPQIVAYCEEKNIPFQAYNEEIKQVSSAFLRSVSPLFEE